VALDRPIFVVAPPRCGTSLLYRCIASHPDAAWFNRADRIFPASPRLALWATRLGGPFGILRDEPRESRDLWFRFLRPRKVDVATAADARPEVRDWYERRIGAVLALRGRTRFVSKLPAHTVQIPFLDALFPGALYVQSMRDWRAVVSSTLVKGKRDFAGGWFGVRVEGWKDAASKPPHLAAAWQYRATHEVLEAEAPRRAGRFFRVQYEELVRDPRATLARLFGQCGLRVDESALARLPADIRPVHERWREVLTPEILADIEREHGDALRRWEYEPARA
jgi:hypothetical protein